MDIVTVTIGKEWVRRLNSPLYYIVATLTGVSVTFIPFGLFWLGRQQISIFDLRVLLSLAVVCLVPGFYIKLAQHVIRQIRK